MPSAAMPRRFDLGQHLLSKLRNRVEAVQRHLHGVERVAVRQHRQVDARVLVAREADEADLALLLGAVQRLDDAAGREVASGSSK